MVPSSIPVSPTEVDPGDVIEDAPTAPPPGDDSLGVVGTVLEGKYRFEKLVAQGGFSLVYRGTDLNLDRPVAIKVLKDLSEFEHETRPVALDRFRREAKLVARLRHPNIVAVVESGVSALGGRVCPWIVLEWIDGHTLAEEFERRAAAGLGRYTPREALTLLRPILEALAHAHDEGIAHRDLKPGNVMVTPTRRGPVVRLLDFGIAKVMDSDEDVGSGDTKTRTRGAAFSPRYLVPEQVSGTRTGPWTDVYGIGLVLTEMLTGRQPYDGEDMTARFIDAMAPLRPTPRKRGVDVGTWEPVLARAVAARPTERYRDVGELLAELDAALPGAERGSLRTPPPPDVVFEPSSADEAAETLDAAALAVVRPPPRRGLLALVVAAALAVAGVAGASLLGERPAGSPVTSSASAALRAAPAPAPAPAPTAGAPGAPPANAAVDAGTAAPTARPAARGSRRQRARRTRQLVPMPEF